MSEKTERTISTASMTGFARHQASEGQLSWVWEAKSVNGKSADVRFRLPNGFEKLEAEIRGKASKAFSRGNIQLSLAVDRLETEQSLSVNRDLIQQLQDFCEENDGIRPSALSLLSIRGVIESAESQSAPSDLLTDETMASLLSSLDDTFSALSEARDDVGQRIGQVLGGLFTQVSELVEQAEALADTVPATVRARFEQQLTKLMTETPPVPEERIAQGIAILATKADIREELDRLRSHITAGFALLASPDPVGRKLDFLCQEFNREANTLCSKAADKKLTEVGLALKAVIDQIKEQVQNIE